MTPERIAAVMQATKEAVAGEARRQVRDEPRPGLSADRPCASAPCRDRKCDHRWLSEHQKWLRICAISEVLAEMLRGEMAGPKSNHKRAA